MGKFDEKMYSDGKIQPQPDNNKKQIYKNEIVWRNVITMTVLHIFGFYGWYYAIKYSRWESFMWAFFIGHFAAFGILVGSHRLWTHRSFKAHWSLRVLLMIMQTMALQNDIYEWARDHRVHHKYSETDADPHNSRRGFFFAHMGWLLVRKHPEVKEKGKLIDMSDVWADPIVRFQRRFYIPLVILIWGIIPTSVPIYLWKEPFLIAFFGNWFRYVLSLHESWLVNSAAHMFGNRPYESRIEPRENSFVAFLALGEGYHNYHHTFPWDYSASEYGWRDQFNLGTAFIDFFAWLGLAYDLRVVPNAVVENRVIRTGEGIHDRLPYSKVFHMIYGLIHISWPIWLSYIISCFIR